MILLQHITLSTIISFSLSHYHFEDTNTESCSFLLMDLHVASISLKGY